MTLQDRLRGHEVHAVHDYDDDCEEAADCLDAKDAEIARLIEIIQEAYETDHAGSFNDWLDMNGYRLAALDKNND